MKTEKNIYIAFILNLAFSIFEFFGGLLTGSVAIVSDALHDLGDAAGIGITCIFEKISKKQPDDKYTYGYTRYSVLGSIITTLILLTGSILVIYNAIYKLINPSQIHYNRMIVFAVIGVCVNFFAAYFTHGGKSLNQKAVNLHMIEDVLGWVVVLIGAIVMRYTDWSFIDPVLSVAVSVFIFINAVGNLKEAIEIILEKTPHGIDIKKLTAHVSELDGVIDLHHIHIWSLDGQRNYATMHVITNKDSHKIKETIRDELLKHGINHSTLEIETEDENCYYKKCYIDSCSDFKHHKHHH